MDSKRKSAQRRVREDYRLKSKWDAMIFVFCNFEL
jgi:hypothetical protein